MRATWPRAAALVLAGFVLAGTCVASRSARSRPVPAEVHYGPATATPPAGAQVVADEAALRAVLADPNGPRDVWLAGRTFHGDLEIKRPIALHGSTGTTLEGSGTGTVVRITTSDVTLEDVVVRGAGQRQTTEDGALRATGDRIVLRRIFVDRTLFGVSLEQCHHCLVEGTHVVGADIDPSFRGDAIKLWESDDSLVKGNLVEHGRDLVVWYSKRVTLEDNVVRDCRYGTHFMYAHDVAVRRSHIENDIVGIFVMYSSHVLAEDNVLAGAHGAAGVGIGFKESDDVTLERNAFVGNSTGIYLDRTPRSPAQPVKFRANVFGANDIALRFLGPERGAFFEGNDFRGNGELILVEGGSDALAATFLGNCWSEYDGYDLDGDGAGDVPFEYRRLSTSLTEANPSLRFLEGTVALGLVDTVADAFPLFDRKLLLVDPRPSLRPCAGGLS